MARFVETSLFSKRWPRFLSQDAYLGLQHELVAHPAKGWVMPGCGGLRKLRIRDPRRQKGTRGGARVIYLHIPEADQFLMLGVYGKGEKDDLTEEDKRELRTLAREHKRRVIEAIRTKKEHPE